MADIVDGNAYVDTDDITGGTDDATHGTGPGTDACKSLAYLMGTRVKTLTGALTVYCKGTAADTAAVTIGGHGATAIKSITIKTDAADRHDGKWNTSKYRLEVAAAYCITLNTEDYVTIDGLQLKSSTNGTWQQTGGVHCYVGSDSSTIKNNLIWTVINQNSGDNFGILYDSYSASQTAYNNVVYMSGTGTPTTTGGIRAEHDSATISLYNNTVVLFVSNYSFGNTCTVVLKNNIANDSGTNGYLLGTGCTTTGSITNLSDKADTFGTSGINSTDLTFVSPGTTAWDYHLAAGDTAAIGVGTNLTATFTTDIDGVTRPAVAAWDLGADQTVSAASALRLLADKMGAMPTEI